ncbi:MAG: hypothetical protein Kow00121_06770 [Elainellaceae cyanobacterium]
MSGFERRSQPYIYLAWSNLKVAHNKTDSSKCRKNQKMQGLQHRPETVFIDANSLSSQLIDDLAETQRNWISLLHSDWEVSLDNFRLVSMNGHERILKRSHPTIRDVVPLILQSQCQPIVISSQTYWNYTFCSQIAGLGRTRLVISFSNSHLKGEYTIFVTNRLDWSPRTIMVQWLQYQPLIFSDNNIYIDEEAYSYQHPIAYMQDNTSFITSRV